MNLDTRKLSFIQEFLLIQNKDLVIEMEQLLMKRKLELLEKELIPMSTIQFNDEIDLALEDSENDKVIKATELKEKWS